MAGMAVVTGASSGIGRSYAERLASNGMDVVVVARRMDPLDALKRELERGGIRVRTIVADLARAEDVQRLVTELATLPVELLVNNAGVAHYMPFAQLPVERARELVDVNALAPVLLTRAAREWSREAEARSSMSHRYSRSAARRAPPTCRSERFTRRPRRSS